MKIDQNTLFQWAADHKDEQLELLNVGGTFELSDDIELTVELINKGEQLHFQGGVQLAVGIEAEFEVELES